MAWLWRSGRGRRCRPGKAGMGARLAGRRPLPGVACAASQDARTGTDFALLKTTNVVTTDISSRILKYKGVFLADAFFVPQVDTLSFRSK